MHCCLRRFVPFFSLFMVLWGVLFVRYWERESSSLACMWKTLDWVKREVPKEPAPQPAVHPPGEDGLAGSRAALRGNCQHVDVGALAWGGERWLPAGSCQLARPTPTTVRA